MPLKLLMNDNQAVLDALDTSLAIIEFAPDGTILRANENFLKAVGYRGDEIKGKHHSLFCEPDYVTSGDYKSFWRDLGNGEFKSNEFKRFRKNGEAIWLQATYNPVKNRHGKVTKVVKFASDITAAKLKAMDDAGKINAIYLSQAVIEFNPDGTIITANDNFLNAVGYDLTDVAGKPHRMFCDPAYAASEPYAKLWRDLRSGKFIAAEFRRLGKGGREVYIQAAYNPIFDDLGQVVKVVKFAVDMTDIVQKRLRND